MTSQTPTALRLLDARCNSKAGWARAHADPSPACMHDPARSHPPSWPGLGSAAQELQRARPATAPTSLCLHASGHKLPAAPSRAAPATTEAMRSLAASSFMAAALRSSSSSCASFWASFLPSCTCHWLFVRWVVSCSQTSRHMSGSAGMYRVDHDPWSLKSDDCRASVLPHMQLARLDLACGLAQSHNLQQHYTLILRCLCPLTPGMQHTAHCMHRETPLACLRTAQLATGANDCSTAGPSPQQATYGGLQWCARLPPARLPTSTAAQDLATDTANP